MVGGPRVPCWARAPGKASSGAAGYEGLGGRSIGLEEPVQRTANALIHIKTFSQLDAPQGHMPDGRWYPAQRPESEQKGLQEDGEAANMDNGEVAERANAAASKAVTPVAFRRRRFESSPLRRRGGLVQTLPGSRCPTGTNFQGRNHDQREARTAPVAGGLLSGWVVRSPSAIQYVTAGPPQLFAPPSTHFSYCHLDSQQNSCSRHQLA
jgi:hypothetical protein